MIEGGGVDGPAETVHSESDSRADASAVWKVPECTVPTSPDWVGKEREAQPVNAAETPRTAMARKTSDRRSFTTSAPSRDNEPASAPASTTPRCRRHHPTPTRGRRAEDRQSSPRSTPGSSASSCRGSSALTCVRGVPSGSGCCSCRSPGTRRSRGRRSVALRLPV